MLRGNYNNGKWQNTRMAIKKILIDAVIGDKEVITYGEVCVELRSLKAVIYFEPDDPVFNTEMLGEISESEDTNNRYMLSAVVVGSAYGGKSQLPGKEFFRLASRLGRKGKTEEMWTEEHKNVKRYWKDLSLAGNLIYPA